MPTKAGDGDTVVCQSGDQPVCVRGVTCQRLRANVLAFGVVHGKDRRPGFKHSRARLEKFVFCVHRTVPNEAGNLRAARTPPWQGAAAVEPPRKTKRTTSVMVWGSSL